MGSKMQPRRRASVGVLPQSMYGGWESWWEGWRLGGGGWCVVAAVAVARCDGGRRESTMTSTNIVLVMAVKSSIVVFWVSGSLVVFRLLDAPSSPSLQTATPTRSSSLMGPYFAVSGLNSIRNEVIQPEFGSGFGFVL